MFIVSHKLIKWKIARPENKAHKKLWSIEQKIIVIRFNWNQKNKKIDSSDKSQKKKCARVNYTPSAHNIHHSEAM